MNPTKHTLLRPRSLVAGLVACAALGVTAPSALADVNVVSPKVGEISITGTGAAEHLSFTYDPQHPKDLLIGGDAPLWSLFCDDDVFNGKAVMRCPDVTRVEIDLSTNNDSLDIVGAVPYRIHWTGAAGDDVVDLHGSTGTNWIDAAPDTGADKYTLTPKTTLNYSGRKTSVQIDHSQPGNDGGNAGGENDAVSGGHGSTYQLTEANDVYFGAPSELSDIVIGGEGDDYLFGGGGDDYLRGYGGNDTLDGTGKLDGGDGNDSLLLHGNNGKPRVLTGGAGIDKVAVGGPQAGGMVVSLDGIANDGYAGEPLTANVGSDVENVDTTGNNLSLPDKIVGSAAENSIVTGGGPDTVNPGGGADTVSTGDGSDTIDSIDGVADAIDCGAGVTDSLSADKIDARKGCDLVVKDLDTIPPNEKPPVDEPPVIDPPVAQPPVAQPPVVQPPAVQPPVVQPPAAKLAVKAKVGKQRLRTLKRTKRLKLQLRVNRAARVAIKVTTRRHGKTIRLGSRSPRIAANQWVKVNVRLSKTQLRKLRKGKRVRIAFKASAGDSRATLSRAVRAR